MDLFDESLSGDYLEFGEVVVFGELIVFVWWGLGVSVVEDVEVCVKVWKNCKK